MRMEVNVPKKLFAAFNESIKDHYASRSEAIRDLMRNFIEDEIEKRELVL